MASTLSEWSVRINDEVLMRCSWEYPNRQGLGCNAINDDDTANFLAFLEELREQPEGKDLYLTAAGSLFPWNNASGVASTDLEGFANVLDYIMIMVSSLLLTRPSLMT